MDAGCLFFWEQALEADISVSRSVSERDDDQTGSPLSEPLMPASDGTVRLFLLFGSRLHRLLIWKKHQDFPNDFQVWNVE